MKNGLRFRRNASGTVDGLQVPIIPFRHSSAALDTIQIDFVGVIHAADSGFYSELNRLLASYDHVLFETVMPQFVIENELFRHPELRPDTDDKSPLRKILFRFLGMSEQVSCLQITRRFIHADISAEELAQRLEESGASEQLFVSPDTDDDDQRIIEAIFSRLSDRWPKMHDCRTAVGSGQVFLEARRVFCDWLESMEHMVTPELRDAVMTARETRAMEVLERVLPKEGSPQSCRIAILFGTAHADSLAALLQYRLGFVAQDDWQWITAIALDETQMPSEEHFQTALQLLEMGN